VISCCVFGQLQSFQITSDNPPLKQTPFFYYLPKTNINVVLEITTDCFIPGPYCHFADKYLFIKDVRKSKTTTIQVSNVAINEYTVPDSDNPFYAIEKNYNFNLSLNSLGILTGYNVGKSDVGTTNFPQINIQNNILDETLPFFTDNTVKSNFSLLTDTTYNVILVDSVFQKIPVFNKQITSKSLEQKAEEAANYILKIREWKFNLKTGQFDTDLPPSNVPEMLKELDQLEQNYTELFIGKKISVTNIFAFDCSPTKEENITMCYLSDENGILTKIEKNAKTLVLKIENNKTNAKIEKFSTANQTTGEKAGLFYKKPEVATVSVVYNNTIIAQKQVVFPQFGLLNILPQKMFENKNLKIIFDENTGTVKSMTN
jgi:hypothetical protein